MSLNQDLDITPKNEENKKEEEGSKFKQEQK